MRTFTPILFLLCTTSLGLADVLSLSPVTGTGAVASYQDFDVVADTGNRPVGGVSFDLVLVPSNVLTFVGCRGTLMPDRGGLTALNAQPTSGASTNIRVVAFNAWRPDVPSGSNRLFTLRFLVNGRPGESCAITLTNVAVFGTAAYSTNDSPCQPLAVEGAGASFSIPADTNTAVWLRDLPPILQKGQIYPVNIRAGFMPAPPAALDLTLRYPSNLIHLVDVTRCDRNLGVTVSRQSLETGVVRLLALNGDAAGAPGGDRDVATLWLEARQDATGAQAVITADINGLYAGPGLEVGRLNASNVAVTVALSSNASPPAEILLADLPARFERNRFHALKLNAISGPHAVSAFDVTLLYATNAVRVVDVVPEHPALRLAVARSPAAAGATRILGLNTASLWSPAGTSTLATVWLDILPAAPAGEIGLDLRVNSLRTGPGLAAAVMSTPDFADRRAVTNAHFAAMLEKPAATQIALNAEFETPYSIETGNWAPLMLGGTVSFDPGRLELVSIQPAGILLTAQTTIATNRLAEGKASFLWSSFTNHLDVQTNGVFPALNLRWRVVGSTLQTGGIAVDLPLAADTLWNGINATPATVGFDYFIRYNPTDADGDNIPDWWAIQYYGGETNAVAGDDTDHDRMTARDEFVCRTDPTNRASFLGLLPITQTSTGMVIRWSSETNVTYVLQRGTNMLLGFDGVLAEGLEATAPTNTYTDTNAPAAQSMFYRVIVPSP